MKRLLAFLFLLASPAEAQNTFFAGNPGDMIYRGTTAWQRVPGGTAGQILQSNGPTAAPTWTWGFDTYTTSPFVLPRIPTNRALMNVTGANAAPTPGTASQFLDTIGYDIQRPPLPGSLLYKDPTTGNWQALQPGLAGWVLLSGGSGVAPAWGFTAAAAIPGVAGTVLTSRGVSSSPSFQSPPGSVSVLAFGAICDGVATDTIAIQAALDSGSAYISTPPGRTCRSSTLTIPANTTFQILGTLKKIGALTARFIICGGDNVTLLGPGALDGNNLQAASDSDLIFCQSNSGHIIDKNLFVTNSLGYGIHYVDVAKFNINTLQSTGIVGDHVLIGATSSDFTSPVLTNSYCDRGSLDGTCYNYVTTGHVTKGLINTGNTCIGKVIVGTTFQSCVQMINAATANAHQGAVVSNNYARNMNYAFSMEGLTDSSVSNLSAVNVNTGGYCMEIANNRNTTWSNINCQGLSTTGALLAINNSTGVVVSGFTLVNTSTDAGSAALSVIPNVLPGKKNVVSNGSIVVAGGTGISLNGNDTVLSNIVLDGASVGVNAINLGTGTGRTLTGILTRNWTGTPIINGDASDTICLNTTLGCRFPGSTSGFASLVTQAIAGTPILTFPNASGTFAVSASAPLALDVTTGALTCPTCGAASALTVGTTTIASGTTTRVLYDNAGVLGEYTNTQLTALLNAATATLSGALPAWPNNTTTFFRGDGTYAAVATVNGVSYPASYTSGGIPYASSTSAISSSGLLAANALVIGGGAGAAPSTTTTGTGVLTALGVNVGSAGAFVTFNGALGTPSSGTLTNATGLPISSGVSGLGTGVATALGANVGSAGAFVVFNGALGTPASGTLTNATGLPISSGVSGLGTGVATALAVNVGSAGAFVTFNGALGTPSSGTATNLTGTASININGTVGATTPTSGLFTTLGATGLVTFGTTPSGSSTLTPNLRFVSVDYATTPSWSVRQNNNIAFGVDFGVDSATTGNGDGVFRGVNNNVSTIALRIARAGGVSVGPNVVTMSSGELGFAKITASGSAPGATACKIEWVAGSASPAVCPSSSTSGKLIAYCGTSTTPVTIIDCVGDGL